MVDSFHSTRSARLILATHASACGWIKRPKSSRRMLTHDGSEVARTCRTFSSGQRPNSPHFCRSTRPPKCAFDSQFVNRHVTRCSKCCKVEKNRQSLISCETPPSGWASGGAVKIPVRPLRRTPGSEAPHPAAYEIFASKGLAATASCTCRIRSPPLPPSWSPPGAVIRVEQLVEHSSYAPLPPMRNPATRIAAGFACHHVPIRFSTKAGYAPDV